MKKKYHTTTERETPHRQPSIEADVIVPFLQSIIISFVVFAIAIFAILAFGVDLQWPAYPALLAATFLLSWLWRQAAAGDTIWTIERVMGVDVDGDGEVGDPAVEGRIIVSGRKSEADLQATYDAQARAKYIRFIRGCAHDTTFRRWEPTLGRERYNEWRDGLIQGGWARWVDPANRRLGWELTAEPDEIIDSVF